MRYKVSATIDGKRKYFYGRTKKDAEQKRDEYLKRQGMLKVMFQTVAEQWWDDTEGELAYNTVRGYKAPFKRAVNHFYNIDVRNIKPIDVATFIREFAKKGYYDKTVRTQLMILNLIFKFAINFMGLDMTNPTRDVQVPRKLKKNKVHIPSNDDIQKMVNAPDSIQKRMAMWFIYTGLRKGELLALTSDDINDGFISVTKSIYHDNNRPRLKDTKTENGRRKIPIVKALEEYLPEKDGIIFDENGNYMRDSVFQKGWYRWCDMYDIHCTPHQLRHLYATMLIEQNNIPPKILQRLMGHANITTTLDIYAEVRESQEQEIADRIYELKVTTQDGAIKKKKGSVWARWTGSNPSFSANDEPK